MSKAVKKVFNVIVDIIVVLILIISIIVVTLSLTSRSSGVPNIFGIAPMSVETESMKDTLNQGDLIFSKVATPGETAFAVDDIVSFYQDIEGKQRINTHRIIEIVKDQDLTYYRTKGDNNNQEDNAIIDNDKVIGKVLFRIKSIGLPSVWLSELFD